MNRADFIRYTVATTLPEYLRRFCAPHPVLTAHERCVEDAEKLADRLYGVVDMQADRSPALPPKGRKSTKVLSGNWKDELLQGDGEDGKNAK
jgi:hypothetical protein